MKAALYIRVSSAEQLHGYSLEAQEKLLRNYAEKNGMDVYGLYADRGKSAYKPLHKREGLLQMVHDAERGLFQCILFKDITRWSRNSSQYWTIQDRLDKCGVYWIAVEQPYLETKTPTGRFQVTVMLGTAQLESENTSQRIRFVQEHRASQGGVLSGKVPLGYKIETINGMKRLVKDPVTAPIIIDLFDRYFCTRNQTDICRFVNNKYDLHYSVMSINQIIHNPIYTGQYRDNANFCEPYLSVSQWNSLQSFHSIQRSHLYNGHNLFRGLLYCPECGKTLTANRSKKIIYYRCYRAASDRSCSCRTHYRQDRIEQAILDEIAFAMDHTEVYSVPVREAHDTESEIKLLNRKLSNLKELFIDGDIDKDTYTTRKRTITAEIDRLQAQQSNPIPSVLMLSTASWRDQYKAKTDEEKGEWFRFMLERIDIDGDRFIPVFRNYVQ